MQDVSGPSVSSVIIESSVLFVNAVVTEAPTSAEVCVAFVVLLASAGGAVEFELTVVVAGIVLLLATELMIVSCD